MRNLSERYKFTLFNSVDVNEVYAIKYIISRLNQFKSRNASISTKYFMKNSPYNTKEKFEFRKVVKCVLGDAIVYEERVGAHKIYVVDRDKAYRKLLEVLGDGVEKIPIIKSVLGLGLRSIWCLN